jgi:small subunit ribosomal protein S6
MAKLNQYEAMFLFPPTGTMELQACMDIARGMVERQGGQIIVLKKWDERKLAYEMAGQKRGLYIICYFRAEGGAIAALDRDARLSEQVMRVLITRADHLNETEMAATEPQPIAPPREDRPSWEIEAPRGPRRPRRDEKEESAEAGEPAAKE